MANTRPTACYCDEGWVCEAHPDQPWLHDECRGPGMPHMTRSCPYGAENRHNQEENDLFDKLWNSNDATADS
jgi:hypothetical protein